MTAVYPSPHNTFIPSAEASGKMVVDYARNLSDYDVNKYTQVVPSKKVQNYYTEMTIEEAGRVLYTDLADRVWYDGAPASEGNEHTEKFEFKYFNCTRYNFPFLLGDLTIEQADWNILAQHASIHARAAMTARTQLALGQITLAGNYAASHTADVALGILGNTSTWTASLTSRQDIRRSLSYAGNIILKDTLAAINLDDLVLVISPELAANMAQSQEIVDHIKGSPDALAQIRGELPNSNVIYGLPAKIYGFPLVVEKTVKVTTRKGATQSRSFILPAATPFLCARPGGLVGVADAPNFSTCVNFAHEEMTVESKRDSDNRRTRGRVVENLVYKVVAPASGFLFTNAN